MSYFTFLLLLIGINNSTKNIFVSCKCPKIYKDTISHENEPGFFQNNLLLILLSLMGLLVLLILLGIIKALLGLFCCSSVGLCGLSLLFDLPRPLDHYEETDLRFRKVVYEENGWPVDPDTGERTVRVTSRKTEFLLNVVFFLTYPLAVIGLLFNLLRNKRSKSGERDRKACRTSSGPSIDFYDTDDEGLEDEDTRYVLHEMKRSRENLKFCKCTSINCPKTEQ